VQQLDWSYRSPQRDEANLRVQQQCVRRIRSLLNITRLQDGVDRDRFSRDLQAARLMVHGQGHCHGLSSVMAAAVYPFCRILGLDMMYGTGCGTTTLIRILTPNVTSTLAHPDSGPGSDVKPT